MRCAGMVDQRIGADQLIAKLIDALRNMQGAIAKVAIL